MNKQWEFRQDNKPTSITTWQIWTTKTLPINQTNPQEVGNSTCDRCKSAGDRKEHWVSNNLASTGLVSQQKLKFKTNFSENPT
jgi:hypothetical protein